MCVYRTRTVVGEMFHVLFNMMLNFIITGVNVVSSGALLKILLCSYCPVLTATLFRHLTIIVFNEIITNESVICLSLLFI